MNNKSITSSVYVRSSARESLRKLIDYIEKEQFRGYDPYDALNSPLIRLLSMGAIYPRIFFTQVLRRIPLNLRPFLGIEKGLNPKALGLFLWGYARLFADREEDHFITIVDLMLDLLERTRSEGYSGNCWGYNFDWQSRAFFVPRLTPTIVNSSFIGHALIDTHLLTGSSRAIEMALPIREFILNDLNRTGDGNAFCFSYTPIDRLTVHNANLLGASLLVRLCRFSGDDAAREAARDAALKALAYSVGHQRPDGSWTHGEIPLQGWTDSFHTGFNLQSILYFIREGFESQAGQAFKRGLTFYRDNFFLEDGTPKYYHDRLHPIDIHAPAQAVAFLSMLGEECRPLTERILGWMITALQSEEGYFYFRKGRLLNNRIPYMRWGQAWAFHALTGYLHESRGWN